MIKLQDPVYRYRAILQKDTKENLWKKSSIFYLMQKGSCGELRTQIYIGMDIGYINKETGQAWIEEAREISMMLNGLMKKK